MTEEKLAEILADESWGAVIDTNALVRRLLLPGSILGRLFARPQPRPSYLPPMTASSSASHALLNELLAGAPLRRGGTKLSPSIRAGHQTPGRHPAGTR